VLIGTVTESNSRGFSGNGYPSTPPPAHPYPPPDPPEGVGAFTIRKGKYSTQEGMGRLETGCLSKDILRNLVGEGGN